MGNYLKFLIVILLAIGCHANIQRYVMVSQENELFKACDQSDNISAQDLWESNFVSKYQDDMETIIYNGNITFKADIKKIAISLDAFLWKRGEWQETLYSMKRNDFCPSLFDPNEFWYSLTKAIPVEDRLCPPKNGTVYHFKDMNNRYNLPKAKLGLEGEYKIKAKFFVDDRSAICYETAVDIWKN